MTNAFSEVKPHSYSPDYQAMGDCRICGNTQSDCDRFQAKLAHDIAMSLSVRESACVIALAWASGYDISHADDEVEQFCDDAVETDTFNRCHELGLLRSVHNSDIGESWVHGTHLGRAVRVILQNASSATEGG